MLKHTKFEKADSELTKENSSKDITLTNSLEENTNKIKDIFDNNDTLIIRRFENQHNNDVKCCIIFIEGMVNNDLINQNVIKPIVLGSCFNDKNTNIDNLMNSVIISNSIKKSSLMDNLIEAIVSGDTVLLLENEAQALLVSTKGWQTRSIIEPEAEKTIRGPREGFTESLMMNLSLIKRKLLIPDLKFKYRVVGKQSRTKICLCYIEGIANNKILNELNNRLDKIDIDGVFDTGYIQELIKDSPLSPFKTIGSTVMEFSFEKYALLTKYHSWYTLYKRKLLYKFSLSDKVFMEIKVSGPSRPPRLLPDFSSRNGHL